MSAFTPDIRSLMSLGLPHDMGTMHSFHSYYFPHSKQNDENEADDGKNKAHIYLCKEATISKENLVEKLTKIVQKGDPIIMVELYRGNTIYFILPTKASLLISSIFDGSSCVYKGELP